MKTMQIGKSGVIASEISIGTFAMSGGTAWSDTKTDLDASVRLLHEAFDLGVTFFDTAPVYGTGRGEEILGRAIADRRDKVVIGTKCSLNWRTDAGRLEYTRDGKASTAVFRRKVSGPTWKTASGVWVPTISTSISHTASRKWKTSPR